MEQKYSVEIYKVDKPARISKEISASLKGVLSGKNVKKMKYEKVKCPVLKLEVPFLECFICQNHIRRFKGMVHCAGNSIT